MHINSLSLKKAVFLLAPLLIISCSPEKPGMSGPAQPSAGVSAQPGMTAPGGVQQGSGAVLEIDPHEAVRNTTLRANARGFDLSGVKTEWLVNGLPVEGSSGAVFKTGSVTKGDIVQARAFLQGKEILSNTVRIGNCPPRVERTRIMPATLKPGDSIYVDATCSDPDGDEVTLLYEWTKNGEPAGKDRKIYGEVKRGDRLSVKITPYDGESYGQPAVISVTVANMPPMIMDDRKYTFDGKVFNRSIKATDPDGDPLTYSLKAAPAGMTINPTLGQINWNVPADYSGKASYTVSVTDGKGGEATQTFTLELRPL
jgi:hypothetical protein